MSILDFENLFCNKLAVTVTADGTNVIDLGGDHDYGPGNPVELLAQVTTEFAGQGSTTLQVIVETDDNSAMSSSEVLYTSEAIDEALLLAGYKFPIRFFPRTNQRYVGVSFVVATGPMTAGNMTVGIASGDQSNNANI